jgi:hypothetical protein
VPIQAAIGLRGLGQQTVKVMRAKSHAANQPRLLEILLPDVYYALRLLNKSPRSAP